MRKYLGFILIILIIVICSIHIYKTYHNTYVNNYERDSTINLAISGEPTTFDPVNCDDVSCARIIRDLFEGIVSFDQRNNVVPGIAESWSISNDGKTYIFNLRKNLYFSDGSKLDATDVIASWRRFADPKTNSLQDSILEFVENGHNVLLGKLPLQKLGVYAQGNDTVTVKLIHPHPSFLYLLASVPGLYIVPTKVIAKYGNKWTNMQHIVGTGAYRIVKYPVKDNILAAKNQFFYDESNVKINKVRYHVIPNEIAQYNQYKTGAIDITNMIPYDQYKIIKQAYPKELHTVLQEAIYFYDFNMQNNIFKHNLNLRMALSMAIDRDVLVDNVLGHGEKPLFSFATSTVAHGVFNNDVYAWSKWQREKQIAEAKRLYKMAGYSKEYPLNISIVYNDANLNKVISLAIASMWHSTLGVNVTLVHQEWKSFLSSRRVGNYEVARDMWIGGNDITDYLDFMFLCGSLQNDSHYCNPTYDKLISLAGSQFSVKLRNKYYHDALMYSMDDYPIIPLFQPTYSVLIKPYVNGYDPSNNHLDDVLTKWMGIAPK